MNPSSGIRPLDRNSGTNKHISLAQFRYPRDLKTQHCIQSLNAVSVNKMIAIPSRENLLCVKKRTQTHSMTELSKLPCIIAMTIPVFNTV